MINYAWYFSQQETEKFFEWIIKKFIRRIVLLTLWTTGGQSRTPVHHHPPLPPLKVLFDINLHQMANTIRPKWCPYYLTESITRLYPSQAASLAEFFNYKPFAASLGTKLTSWRSRNALGQDKRPFKVVISFDCLVPLRLGLVPREWLA